MRMCLGCREMKAKKELIRIVMNKDGNVSLDPTGKLAGRGAYICKSNICVSKLRKAHGIEKNFKCQASQDIYDKIETELKEFE